MTGWINKKQFQYWLFAGLFISSLATAILTEQFYWTFLPLLFLFFYWAWSSFYSVFALLLLAIPFSFGWSFSSELSTDIPDEFFMWSVMALMLFYGLYFSKSMTPSALRHPLLLLLLFDLFWITLSMAFSTDIIVSLKFLLAKCWYIGAFVFTPLFFFRQEKNIRDATRLIGLSMLLVVCIIMIKHALYGFEFAHINHAVSPFFSNHVIYAALLVCMLPLFFAFYHLSFSKWKKRLIAVAVIILLIALFLSYSRGAWLALLAGLATYWLIKRKLLFTTYILTVFITLGFLFWLKSGDRYLQFAHDYKTTIFHKDFREHLVATYKLKDVSTAERFYRWIAGVRMIKDKILTGYGPNTFYNNYKSYAVPAFKTWVSDNKDHSTVHNYFLLITIEQGIPGLVFFLLLLGGAFFYAQQLYHRVKSRFYKTVAATTGVVLMMIVVVNFLSDLIETDKVGSIFFLCIAVLIGTDVNTKKQSDPAPDIQGIPQTISQ
jgi:O-antigen ligase